MGNATKAVTDASFEKDVLKSEAPVVVDFWAEWCGPCKAIGPALEELATEFAGQVTIAKLDIDSNAATTRQYRIQGVPTLMMFKGGKVVATHQGSASKKRLEDWIKSSMATA